VRSCVRGKATDEDQGSGYRVPVTDLAWKVAMSLWLGLTVQSSKSHTTVSHVGDQNMYSPSNFRLSVELYRSSSADRVSRGHWATPLCRSTEGCGLSVAMALTSGYTDFPNPLPMFLLEVSTTALVVGLTRANSVIRLAVLPWIAFCAYTIVMTSVQHMRAHWASLFFGTSVGFVLQYIDVALLSRLSSGPDNSGRSSGAQASLRRTMQCLRFGFLSTLSFRHIGLSTEVKNVPWFSHSPAYIPSRRAFLVRSTAIALTCCVIIDVSAAQSAPSDPAALFSWDVVPLFTRSGQLTSSQLYLRLLSSLVYWTNMFCVMQGLTSDHSRVGPRCRLRFERCRSMAPSVRFSTTGLQLARFLEVTVLSLSVSAIGPERNRTKRLTLI